MVLTVPVGVPLVLTLPTGVPLVLTVPVGVPLVLTVPVGVPLVLSVPTGPVVARSPPCPRCSQCLRRPRRKRMPLAPHRCALLLSLRLAGRFTPRARSPHLHQDCTGSPPAASAPGLGSPASTSLLAHIGAGTSHAPARLCRPPRRQRIAGLSLRRPGEPQRGPAAHAVRAAHRPCLGQRAGTCYVGRAGGWEGRGGGGVCIFGTEG